MIAMPFGRYEGRDITTVPRGYLRWLRSHADLVPQLAHVVDCVINKQPIDMASIDVRTAEDKVDEIVKPWNG